MNILEQWSRLKKFSSYNKMQKTYSVIKPKQTLCIIWSAKGAKNYHRTGSYEKNWIG